MHPDDLTAIQHGWDVLRAGGRTEVRFRFRHADGSWRWLEAIANLVRTASGPLAVIVGRDMTDRLRIEQQLRESQRMESLGQLAGGIAHDFNNLLQIIRGRTELAVEMLPSDHEAQSDLTDALAATRRAASLVQQLLIFARRQPTTPQPTDIGLVLRDIAALLERAAGSAVTLDTRSAPDLWHVRSDPIQIEQLLTNLVLNARDGACGRWDDLDHAGKHPDRGRPERSASRAAPRTARTADGP